MCQQENLFSAKHHKHFPICTKIFSVFGVSGKKNRYTCSRTLTVGSINQAQQQYHCCGAAVTSLWVPQLHGLLAMCPEPPPFLCSARRWLGTGAGRRGSREGGDAALSPLSLRERDCILWHWRILCPTSHLSSKRSAVWVRHSCATKPILPGCCISDKLKPHISTNSIPATKLSPSRFETPCFALTNPADGFVPALSPSGTAPASTPGPSLGGSSWDRWHRTPAAPQKARRPKSPAQGKHRPVTIPWPRSIFLGQMPSLLKQQPLKNKATETISVSGDPFPLPPYKTTPALLCLQVSGGWKPDICAWHFGPCSALGTRATGSSTAGHGERGTTPANGKNTGVFLSSVKSQQNTPEPTVKNVPFFTTALRGKFTSPGSSLLATRTSSEQ